MLSFSSSAFREKKKQKQKQKNKNTRVLIQRGYYFNLDSHGPPWYTFKVRNSVSTFPEILLNPSACVLQRLGRLDCLFNITNDLETLKEDRRKLKVEDEEGGGQRLMTLSVLYSRDNVSDFCLKSLSLTRSVAMKIYWNKKERLHKKRN